MAGLSRRRYCIGLTGGIGSGKTTVSDMFAALGASIVDTDIIAHRLTTDGGTALPAIRARFGPEMIKKDGSLDRTRLRRQVFSEPGAKHDLEAILHPLIRQAAARLCERADGPYVILVIPLLAEHFQAYSMLLDRVAVVDSDEAMQVARAATRPGLDEPQVRAILAQQARRDDRLALANDVIVNRSDLGALKCQVEALHRSYLVLAENKAVMEQDKPLR